jgi:hypothetical protein
VAVSHPNLGLPPTDARAGYPDAARSLRAANAAVGLRALEAAVEADPTIRERLGDLGLRQLLRDTEIWVDRIAMAVGAGDPSILASWAEQIVAPYRRRRVSMDDLTLLADGFRASVRSVVGPQAQPAADAGLDAAIAVFRWHRRLAGDARKRNKLLQFIYKGA